jgi:hypothetical protein
MREREKERREIFGLSETCINALKCLKTGRCTQDTGPNGNLQAGIIELLTHTECKPEFGLL